jgi:hypothetical protein
MMQEPHCLNTSILDCSVTFTVDRDICIHGIEVPSQVTEVPANIELPMLQNLAAQANNQAANAAIAGPAGAAGAGGQPANNNQANSTEYNELLYAHLLDADGNRLTYTHFTAKVHSLSKKSTCICRNKSSPSSFSMPGIIFPPYRNIYSFIYRWNVIQ